MQTKPCVAKLVTGFCSLLQSTDTFKNGITKNEKHYLCKQCGKRYIEH